nr:uncharacterized protein LOC128672684 [Plodia interpunctella]
MCKIFVLCIVIVCLIVLVNADESTKKYVPSHKTSACNCRCGERNEPPRIVDGTETGVNEFPWVARLSYFNKFYCAGMLINDKYVLTAAHCVKGFMWFMIRVTLGEHNRCNATHRPETRYVTKAIAHNFTFATFRNDIALLKLNRPVATSDVIKPICLPLNDDETYVGIKAIATGWGSVTESKNQSCVLMEVELPIISNEECRSSQYDSNMISDNMLCAGLAKGGKDTCQGDSGGPLCADKGGNRYELLGVVSWGIGCGRPGYPGVYTRVTKYLDWILDNGCPGGFCTNSTNSHGYTYANGSVFGVNLRKMCLCRCGVVQNKTYPYQFPWLAVVHTGSQLVGGSLISDQHVLTSASELFGLPHTQISITLGSHDRCGGGHSINVSAALVSINPGYSPTSSVGMQDYGLIAWTSAWRLNSDFSSCIPRLAISPVFPASSCAGSVNHELLTSDKGCFNPLGSRSFICELDLGAPVFWRRSSHFPFLVIGVISSSPTCPTLEPNATSLFTKHEYDADDVGIFTVNVPDFMFNYKMKQSWFIICLVIELLFSQGNAEKQKNRHLRLDEPKVNTSCECGIAGKNRRIVGGTTVQPHQYPWLVSLMLGQKLHCGGAIISDQHVLTAGHCITFGVHFHDLTVNIGMHDRLETNAYSVLNVINGVKHPKFTSNAVRDINDIAVLTLSQKLKFSDRVLPICLPDEEMDFRKIPLTVAGWGKTRQGALTSSRYLLETKVGLVDPRKCSKSNIYRDNLVKETMMCAYSLGKDACQGDSGGPLFATHDKSKNRKWYQVGIVSWGIDCAKPDYPGVYTVVSKYVKWIKQQSREGMYCAERATGFEVLSGTENNWCECGRQKDVLVSMRIVGGRRAQPHSFPWAMAILKNDRMHCGGALITDKHILSAGHCFKWDDSRTMKVLIGLHDLDKLNNVTTRTISKVVIHEKFTSTAVRDENDIAIATLNQPVTFSPYIIPVCLPDRDQNFGDWAGTIVGWGRVGVEKASSRTLLMASLRILPDEKCEKSELAQHLKPTMMCAFSKGKDGCQGDSGGPLIVLRPDGKYLQAGIISWGIGCADPRYPGVYTKVSNYIDWIHEHTSDGVSCP